MLNELLYFVVKQTVTVHCATPHCWLALLAVQLLTMHDVYMVPTLQIVTHSIACFFKQCHS